MQKRQNQWPLQVRAPKQRKDHRFNLYTEKTSLSCPFTPSFQAFSPHPWSNSRPFAYPPIAPNPPNLPPYFSLPSPRSPRTLFRLCLHPNPISPSVLFFFLFIILPHFSVQFSFHHPFFFHCEGLLIY